MDNHDSSLALFHRLRRASMELELARSEFAHANGLHPTDLRALIALLDAGRVGTPATPGWLGEQLGLNSAGTTALLDRLERLGHLQRIRDREDRRKVFLEVTAQAVDLGRSFFGPLIEATVNEMSTYSGAELAGIGQFLDSVADIAATSHHGRDSRTSPGR